MSATPRRSRWNDLARGCCSGSPPPTSSCPLLALARFAFQRVPVALLGWSNLFDKWTWDGLFDALRDPGFGSALWLSVRLALGAIVLTLGLLLPTALWVHLRAPSARGLVEVLSVLPYVVPRSPWWSA